MDIDEGVTTTATDVRTLVSTLGRAYGGFIVIMLSWANPEAEPSQDVCLGHIGGASEGHRERSISAGFCVPFVCLVISTHLYFT
jgi:hypothetical protein